MAISINWPTAVIYIPKADLILKQETPTEIRELNLNAFRLILKGLEDDPDGMPFPKTHIHNTEVNLGGLTYARVINILEPYTITFEDGRYAVNLTGANSNVGDKVNVNQVSIRSQNSAGMTSIGTNLWTTIIDGNITAQESLRIILGVLAGKTTIIPGEGETATVIFRGVNDDIDRLIVLMNNSERNNVTINKE